MPGKLAWFLPATPYIHVPPLSLNHQCFPAFPVIPSGRSQYVYIFSLSFAEKWVRKSDRAFTGWEQICICIKCISRFLNSFDCTRHFYNRCVHRLVFCSHCPFFPPTEQHPDPKISLTLARERKEEKLWLPVAWERRKKERTVSMKMPHILLHCCCYSSWWLHSLTAFPLNLLTEVQEGCLRHLNNRALPWPAIQWCPERTLKDCWRKWSDTEDAITNTADSQDWLQSVPPQAREG